MTAPCASAATYRDESVASRRLPADTADATFARADAVNAGRDGLNIFTSADPADARAHAAAATGHLSDDLPGLLLGVPVALKDNIATTTLETTCGSRILAGYVSPYEATVVRKLRDSGAILVGKTNMDEFAMGSSTEHSAYGATRNPLAPDRVPGGSSGGSAAAVAAGIVPLAHANDEIAKMPVGKTDLIKWKSKDGREIEGLLTYPVGYVAGTKVPFILNIHGGPAGVITQNYIGGRGVYPLATFAARGYAILRANPRGSSGYGTEFRRANFKDWGGMDYQDLMAGVDKVIEMGVADPNRMGVMGWSYGGYMTSWIVTQTKRFKAASAGAPVTNLMSFNGTADIPAFVPDYFGGQAWEIPEVYAKHSAMFNIKGVTTPTLIEQGDADVRVPISQGYEFYQALKLQGVPTRMIVLPRQPHGPTEPKMQIAAMQANLDWFEKYLK